MDVTPQSLRDVRFREKLRGYNPEDVDEFVTKVASLVDSLQREVYELRAQLQQRPLSSSNEGAPAEPPTATSDAEESLKRTLVLAQRTADLAIQEARAEATRILDEAEAERARLDGELAQLRSQLMGEARREAEEEMHRLATLRTQLLADVSALEGHAAAQREHLRTYFTDQLAGLERGAMSAGDRPVLQAGDDGVIALPAADAADEEPPGGAVFDAEADVNTDSPVNPDSLEGSEGDDHDPFIAELRRAITDEAPLGPRDESVPDLPPQSDEVDFFRDDEEGAGRLGSRLRRRK